MVTNLTDEQLVEMAITENPDAFGVIVNRWERKIFALCYGMLSREDEAKDAAQETFIAAYRNLKNFRGDAKVSSWLHRIAVNQCLTTKRRTKQPGDRLFPVFIPARPVRDLRPHTLKHGRCAAESDMIGQSVDLR